MAGGGIRPGLVYGSSDKDGGYPLANPVTPDDVTATMFHCLGIDPAQHMFDRQQRPIPLSYGTPLLDLLG
jgi:hypothetical protein